MSARRTAAERMASIRTGAALAGDRAATALEREALNGGWIGDEADIEVAVAAATTRHYVAALDRECAERERAELIIDGLRLELAKYRPELTGPEAALDAPGYWLVSAARSRRWGPCLAPNQSYPYPVAGTALPDYNAPAKATACGRNVLGVWGNGQHGTVPAQFVCEECRAALDGTAP